MVQSRCAASVWPTPEISSFSPSMVRSAVRSIAAALIGEPRVVVLDTFERLLASVNLLDELLEHAKAFVVGLLQVGDGVLQLRGADVVGRAGHG